MADKQRRKSHGRPFTKGQSGNPKGRPALGDSLAEQIRVSGTPERRGKLFDQMWALAAESHSDPNARVKAAEWLAKHGWPDETRGTTTVKSEDGGKIITVTHVHHD